MADTVLLEFEIVHMDELAGLLQRFKQVLVFLHACGDYGHLIVRIERESLLSEGIHHDAVRLLCYGREPQKVAEAEKRGLPNIKSMVDAIPAYVAPESVEAFEKFGVFTKTELESRVEIEYETYAKTINIENTDENGNVLSEFNYPKGMSPIGDVHDMFVFAGKVNGLTADIALDFRPFFSGTVANMPMGNLLRVDIVIAECEPRYNDLPCLFVLAIIQPRAT